jgi:Holliday junction resolvase-like predicted endonuclease
MTPPDWLPWVLTALLALFLIHTLIGTLTRRFRMFRRFRKGREGETEALALLREEGYRILDAQVTRKAVMFVDDERREATVRADLLVRKQGRTYVVEVKTGAVASDPAASATRRQLLEYAHVYRCDGLLFADMERRTLHTIRFDAPGRAFLALGQTPWRALFAALAIGFALGLITAIGF